VRTKPFSRGQLESVGSRQGRLLSNELEGEDKWKRLFLLTPSDVFSDCGFLLSIFEILVAWGSLEAQSELERRSMSLTFDPLCQKTVEEVRDDSTSLNWVSFAYATKAKLQVENKGEGG
jgi:hypothetical protein